MFLHFMLFLLYTPDYACLSVAHWCFCSSSGLQLNLLQLLQLSLLHEVHFMFMVSIDKVRDEGAFYRFSIFKKD